MSIRLTGAAILVVAAFYIWISQGYEASFGDVLGPAVFPLIVGVPAILLSASLVVAPAGRVSWPPARRMARQAAALAILVGYAWLLRPLGFPIATFGLIAGLGIVLGGDMFKALALGAVASPALWALFDQVLGLPLDLLGAWFG